MWSKVVFGYVFEAGIMSADLSVKFVQERAPDHWHYSRQHLGPLPSGAVARLWPGGDPTFLLALIFPRLPAGQDLLQGSKNGY